MAVFYLWSNFLYNKTGTRETLTDACFQTANLMV
jgi:hypothetical protein